MTSRTKISQRTKSTVSLDYPSSQFWVFSHFHFYIWIKKKLTRFPNQSKALFCSGFLAGHFPQPSRFFRAMIKRKAIQGLVIFDACQLKLFDSHLSTISGYLEQFLAPHQIVLVCQCLHEVGDRTVKSFALLWGTGLALLIGMHIKRILRIFTLFVFYWKEVHYRSRGFLLHR